MIPFKSENVAYIFHSICFIINMKILLSKIEIIGSCEMPKSCCYGAFYNNKNNSSQMYGIIESLETIITKHPEMELRTTIEYIQLSLQDICKDCKDQFKMINIKIPHHT